MPWQAWVSPPHLLGWRPVRPFAFGGNPGRAAPGHPDTADPDAVTERLAVPENQVEPALARVDDNGPGPVIAGIAHGRPRHWRSAVPEHATEWVDGWNSVVVVARLARGRRKGAACR